MTCCATNEEIAKMTHKSQIPKLRSGTEWMELGGTQPWQGGCPCDVCPSVLLAGTGWPGWTMPAARGRSCSAHGSQVLLPTPSILKHRRVLRALPSSVCPHHGSGSSRTVLPRRTEAVVGAAGRGVHMSVSPAAAQRPGGCYAEGASFTLPPADNCSLIGSDNLSVTATTETNKNVT